MASAMAKYGKFYWCVKSRLAEDDEIYVVADEVQTLSDGSLVFFHIPTIGPRTINLAISRGNWQAVNMVDGSALAIDRWKGELPAACGRSMKTLAAHRRCRRSSDVFVVR